MKNFKQFTTCRYSLICSTGVFMMVQRWRISSNSQLTTLSVSDDDWCLWWFKDEEFQAIHNEFAELFANIIGVYDGSKMKNFKQFTTTWSTTASDALVFMMVQRWRISSNSQQGGEVRFVDPGCLWWFKDEEFQAIHNHMACPAHDSRGVYDGSKMKNFKQFTTMEKFAWRDKRCLWWFKDEEFQAIHNEKQWFYSHD